MSPSPLLLLLVTSLSSLCGASNTCGGTEYDDKKQVCCGLEVHTKDLQFMCCSGEWFSTKEYNCLFDVMAIAKDLFCGREQYDELKEVCCGGEIHQKEKLWMCCGGEWISKDDYNCIYDTFRVRWKYHCYGSFLEFYNPSTEMCCNGNVIKKSPNAACCGGVVFYDPTKAVCEDNNVREILINRDSE